MTFAGMLLSLLKGPKVYAYIREQDAVFPSNTLEFVGETMLTVISGCRSICTVFSPFLFLIAYNRSLLNGSNFVMLAKFTVTYYVIAMSTRTIGRMFNPEYRKFAGILFEANQRKRNAAVAVDRLREYDFEIFAAPFDFQARKEPRRLFKSLSRFTNDENVFYTTLRDCRTCNIIFTFARVLIYPGSVSLLNKGGQRGILITPDGNRIDTMFIDYRNKTVNGNTLIVTCEGNAGFYETGIMITPLSLNYSVLGWNQPGFGESSGMPVPEQITASVDAVMQYAIHKLGFTEDQIVIYAWSIGGFPATWAAANYPKIKALILDATFDDLLPLARAKMPKSWASLVEFIIRTYFDLPVALQLSSYAGPVVLIRRTQDEMIITDELGTADERLATNRANDLLKSILRTRYPKLLNNDTEALVDIWLSANATERLSMIKDFSQSSAISNYGNMTEHQRNTLIYFLCSKYMIDFDSNHNAPLNPALFQIPTEI